MIFYGWQDKTGMKDLALEQFAPIKHELLAVEEKLAQALTSQLPLISELGKYLCATGGKRFRPALIIFFYKLCGASTSREVLIEIATALEMIHLATLAHDDVIDQAERRRNKPSLQEIFSNRIAVLEGDFIFSRVFRIMNKQNSFIRSLIIETVEQILEGELLQEALRWRIPTEAEYFSVIERKTAALISTACTLGALLGDPQIAKKRLAKVISAGILLGMAYQMVDDLLDIFGDGELGKPTWKDRNGGWVTLPFIRLLKFEDEKKLQDILVTEKLAPSQQTYLLNKLAEYNIKESFLQEAQAKIEEAKRFLNWLPDGELKQALFGSMDYVVTRTV